jgi:hypothetical protein
MTNRQESAQTLALQALGWLAADDDRFGSFLAAGGMDAASIRAQAADPMLHAAVMDFLLADENMLLQFCEDCGVKPEVPMQARAALPGGDAPFWT